MLNIISDRGPHPEINRTYKLNILVLSALNFILAIQIWQREPSLNLTLY